MLHINTVQNNKPLTAIPDIYHLTQDIILEVHTSVDISISTDPVIYNFNTYNYNNI